MNSKLGVGLLAASMILGLGEVLCEKSESGDSEIETTLVCRSQWQYIRLKWIQATDSSTKSSFSRNSSLWKNFTEGIRKKVQQDLMLAAKYSKNLTASYSCYGNITVYLSGINTTVLNVNNVSFQVEQTKLGSQFLGVKFLVYRKFEHRLQFYLRPTPTVIQDSIEYALHYCRVKRDYDLRIKYACPKFVSVGFKCFERKEGVYGVPDSNGYICLAQPPQYANTLTTYKFYIVTRENDFTSTSHEFSVTTSTRKPRKTPTHGPGEFLAVLFSQKPSYLSAKPEKSQRRVFSLNWEKTSAGSYSLGYNCSNGLQNITLLSYGQNSFSISNDKFRPYLLCRFCVRGRRTTRTLWSEPVCNTTRLHEETPTEPPKVTCENGTCPYTTDGKTRNVTLNCDFPPRETRNGVLTRLGVRYWNETSESGSYQQQYQHNLSVCQVMLVGLSNTLKYYARFLICNSQGCSGVSREILIPALKENQMPGDSEASLWWLFLLPGLIFLAIVVLVVLWYRKSRKASRKALPTITDPDPRYEILVSGNQELQSTERYDQLPGDNNISNDARSDNGNARSEI